MKTRLPIRINKRMRSSLIFPLLFCTFTMQAVPSLILTPTNGTCVSDCKITATVSGALGDEVTYSLINYPTQGQNSTPQSSNIFEGLMPGTYTVGVYDATTGGVPVIATTSVTTSYIGILGNTPVASATSLGLCGSGYSGTLTISFTGGKAPFRIKITNETTGNSQEITNLSSRSHTFSSLPSGNYSFEVEDACEQWFASVANTPVAQNSTATSLLGLNITGVTISRSTNSYESGTVGNCTTLNIALYDLETVITTNGQPTNFNPYQNQWNEIEFRIEYPANSGTVTGWKNFVSGFTQVFTISNYNRTQTDGDKYRVQVKHPCTGVVTSSQVYTLMPEGVFKATASYTEPNYCTYSPQVTVSLPTSGHDEIRTFECHNPYTFTLKQGTTTIATKTTTGTGYSATFTATDGVTQGETYTVQVAGTNGFSYTTNSVEPGTQTPFSSRLTYYTYDNVSYVPGTNYNDCDYNTTRLYARINPYISNQSVTYTIAATGATPAITRNPITLASGGTGYLWTDIPWGTYNITATPYNCVSYTKAVTLTQPVNGFNADQPTFSDAVVCGRFALSGKAYFQLNGSVIANTSAWYDYYMLIVDGPEPEKVGTRVYAGSNRSATITDLSGGDYTVVFYPRYATVATKVINGKSVANYPVNTNCMVEKKVSISEYIRPIINIPLSGGISCTNGLTNMTITVGQGSKPAFSYRYKAAGAADNTYSPANFQASNVFPNIAPGNYTIQVKDQCGSITTQDVRVFNGNEQFVGIVGEVKPGVICEGREVILSVLSIGPVDWYKWYYSVTGEANTWMTLPSENPTYVINPATQSHKGYYKVEIYNGLCKLESQVHIIDVIPPAATPSITGGDHDICAGESTTLTAEIDDAIVSPSYRWYKDGVAITGAYSNTYTVVTTGSYTVDVTPALYCSSYQSSAFEVTALQLAQPVISPTGASICIGEKITLTATTSDSGVSYTWYKNGTQVSSSTSNTYDASESGTYTVTTTHIQLGCVSSASVGVVINVNPIVTPSVAISAVPGFEVCESNVSQIMFTATPTNGGNEPTYVWKVNGKEVGKGTTLTLNNLKQYRPKSTVSCTMTSDNVPCSTTTATDEKNIRISSCVIPVNPSIRGRISN